MPHLDPAESQQALKDSVQKAITDSFPYEGKKHILRVKDVEVVNEPHIADVRAQKKAKLKGRTFGSDIKATLELVDKETGKVIDKQRRKIATLPHITRRYSYIVNGSEFQVNNLWTLKPGVYTRIKQNGELESQVNVKGGGFHVGFDPQSRRFKVRHGGANPPLYPIMKAMGVDDDTLERKWGKEILEANRKAAKDPQKTAIDFAKRLDPTKNVTTYAEAQEVITETLGQSEMKPEVTKRTLGKSIDRITPEAMVLTTGRLLGVSRGDEEPDDRDSLMFKELRGTEDFVADRVRDQGKIVSRKVFNNLDRREKLGDIVGPDLFNRPIRTMFSKSSLSEVSDQTNPLAMITAHQKTTIMGDEGGIKSAHRVTDEAKLVNPSHFGFLDPLHTPEGEKTGVSLHTALGVKKTGTTVHVPMFNVKTGKIERVDPSQVMDSTIIMPDEVKWKKGKPVPKKRGKIKASLPGNAVGEVDFKDADYVMPSSGQAFSIAMNMVPFIGNNSQNRATMSGRHQEQAVGLKHREAPLVQSVAGGDTTFDKILGGFTAQTAPVSGKVVGVKKDGILIEDENGKRHDVPIYDHYPTNEKKGYLDSLPVVKKGQTVKKGDLIADTNYTKDGVYAPGTNMRVAYVAARGYNVEDGIVISESAAEKLTSEHMLKKKLSTRQGQVMGLKKFKAYFPDRVTKEQADKLDDDGVVRVGQKVETGDTLIAGMSPRVLKKDEIDLSLIHKSLVKPFKDKSVQWESDNPGRVVEVVKKPKGIEVHVRSDEPAKVGDKIVSRHANKGIITQILPDSEMPHTESGKAIEILHNPMGVPGRMNVGQLLETAASKVARKTGKPFTVKNFEMDDARAEVEAELKKNGLTDKEPLIDPKTGKKIPAVMTGHQYTLKLHHQVDDKMSARSRDSYDRNLIPKGGGEHGGQAIGQLELYALLAHGAKHNIREMATYKADKAQGGDNDALWGALQAGELLPPPKTTFAYKKFQSYLNALGVNTTKDGNSIVLSPLTDKQTLEMSSGEIKDGGRMVKMKTLEPEKGGLFDPEVTGGEGGKKWAHIELKESMPNPVFEGAIRFVAGVRKPQLQRIIEGKEGVTADGEIVGKDVEGAIYGPSAVGRLLSKIDVEKELSKEEGRIQGLRGQQLNETNKRIKYLRALKKLDMTPEEAYMTKAVPVLPPVMRPLSVMDDGNIQFDDINHLYKQLSLSNQKLGEMHRLAPDEEKAPLRAEIYDELKALSGTGGTLNRQYPGILDTIAGASPKQGFFQDKLVKKRQDMTLRSTIVPNPALSLDEIGVPRKAAVEAYKPFVVRELRRSQGMSPLEAQQAIIENRGVANKALDRVVKERPLIVKRDPVLHKFGVQAFNPVLTEGKAIEIHPIVTSGFNADFDGDAMAGFVPVTREAVEEARKMMPSSMLFSPATGKAAYTPIKEMQVGLYSLSEVGKKTKKKFKSEDDLEKAVAAGQVDVTDVVTVAGHPEPTTAGRLRILSAMPDKLKKKYSDSGLLYNLDYRFTKKDQGRVFNEMARADPKSYGENVDRMKDLGNEQAFMSGFSFGLQDMRVHRDIRDPILSQAAKRTSKLDLNKKEDAETFVKEYEKALVEMESKVKDRAKGVHNNLDRLEMAAGIKGNAYRQLTAAPVLFTDATGSVVTTPVNRSYSEGLGVADYWASMSGGRKGILQKVQAVAQPGYLSKLIMNATMNQLVQGDDCGTTRGISLPTDETDVVGRYTQADVKLNDGRVIPKDTLITPGILSDIRNSRVSKIVVRSPTKCNHAKGVCPKCYGLNEDGKLHDEGTNIGVLAAQSLGERGVQLSMRMFHCSHADTLIMVRVGSDVMTMTMEDFFDTAHGMDLSGVEIYDGRKWVRLLAVKRHEPTRPMTMVSDGNFVTICQDNHPVEVRRNLVRCESCGYPRLKKPSKSNASKNARPYCPKCGQRQDWPAEEVGPIEYGPPAELDPKRWFLSRSLAETLPEELIDLDLHPYVVGMYLAEGCTSWKYAGPGSVEKKPYYIDIAQNAGDVRDKVEALTSELGWDTRVLQGKLRIYNLELGARFHSLFGRYAWKKALPPDFLSYTTDYLADVLCGIIDGDGTLKQDIDGATRIAVDTTSFAMAQQIVLICARLGIVANFLATTSKDLTRHQGYRVVLRVTHRATVLLNESLKVRSIEKVSPPQSLEMNGPVKLSNVREVRYDDEFVYDVTTESGLFWAGGIISHNSGGVHDPGSKSVGDKGLDRAQELFHLPQTLKGSATLSKVNGKVTEVDEDPAGGWNVKIEGRRHYVPADRKLNVKKGDTVKKGAPISSGPVNPHDMLPLTGIEPVQNYLADELHDLYKDEGIRRRNTEVVVRSMSDVTKVRDPGDHPDFVRGDFANTSQVQYLNKTQLKGKKPIKHSPVIKGVQKIPQDVLEDWMARLNQEELKSTVIEGAQRGWKSDIHGPHPIPGVVFGSEFGRGEKGGY